MEELPQQTTTNTCRNMRPPNINTNVGAALVCRWLVPLQLLLFLQQADAVDFARCQEALGMQSGDITDWALRASSSYDDGSVGPTNARVRVEQNGGAWCPKQPVSRNVYEWLEIDLQQLHVVTQVETQGRFGNGQGQEYVEQYMLEYQRQDGGPWARFHDHQGTEVFNGNVNTFLSETRLVSPPIIARKIRFVPYSVRPRTVCLRVEVYGCLWTDGLVSYSMPQGERRGSELDFLDYTYDGRVTDTQLSGGLGQLTDGLEGTTNFRFDQDGSRRKGYDWVGWKNETADSVSGSGAGSSRGPVQIVFQFDRVRNFSSVTFHVNNLFTKDVRVFRRAVIHFSSSSSTADVDRIKAGSSRPVVYDFVRDNSVELARNVVIPIPQRIGRLVMIELYFDAKWLMISEVKFESDVVTGNLTDDSWLIHDPVWTQPSDLLPAISVTDEAVNSSSQGSSSVAPAGGNDHQQQLGYLSYDQRLEGAVIGGMAVTVLLLIVLIVLCVVRRCVWSALTDKLICQRLSGGSSKKGYDNVDSNQLALPYTVAYRDLQHRQLPEVPGDPQHLDDVIASEIFAAVADNTTSTSTTTTTYAVITDEFTSVPTTVSSCRRLLLSDSPPPLPPPVYPPLPVPNGSVFMLSHGSDNESISSLDLADTLPLIPPNVPEISRDSLVFVEKLGKEHSAETWVCQLFPIDDVTRRTSGGVTLVAVKSLSKNADEKSRCDFYRELRTLGRLRDVNVVQLIGVCSTGCVSMVTEYMMHGDLKHFLQNRNAVWLTPGTSCADSSAPSLTYGALIYMATQIASGMKYLESLSLVHRDLAARNCLVGDMYQVKITDFVMCRSVYNNDYYRVEGHAVLPLRWMAWESILLGKFSTKSDVWSFGVTLWEILTLCRTQPFHDLDDRAVIDNCRLYFDTDSVESHVILPRPPVCPTEIYDLMRQCWEADHMQRPTFREIHMFLQRKNHGYNPEQDLLPSAADSSWFSLNRPRTVDYRATVDCTSDVGHSLTT